MEPRAAPVLVGAADADLRRARIPEQEIGERIARPLTVEREVAPRVGRVDRVELAGGTDSRRTSGGDRRDRASRCRRARSCGSRARRTTVGSPIVLKSPPKDTCGYPMSRGILRHALQAGQRREVHALIRAHLAAAGAADSRTGLRSASSIRTCACGRGPRSRSRWSPSSRSRARAPRSASWCRTAACRARGTS